MNLRKFLNKGFKILANNQFTYDGVSYDCIIDSYNSTDIKDYAYELDREMKLSVSSVGLPTLKGKVVTIDGVQWRVMVERIGADYTTLTLTSPSKS